MNKVVAYAPGKLMLAGEMSVLEMGNTCLVAALDRGITVTAGPCDAWVLHAPDIGVCQLPLGDGRADESSDLVALPVSALRVAGAFLQEHGYPVHPLHIAISSDISMIMLPDGTMTKPGLGSSSATTVALIKAVLEAAGFLYSAELIFKLAAIAQGSRGRYIGSCFDIAAAAFGSALVYSRFDPDWFKQFLKREVGLSRIVEQVWPGLFIQPVQLPATLELAVGFTGKSAASSDVIIQLEAFKQRSPGKYIMSMAELNTGAQALTKPLLSGDQKDVFEVCQAINSLFVALENQSGITCMTKGLEDLIRVAGAYGVGAKQSGAGGGDCGIAFCFQPSVAEKVKKGWWADGIMPLEIGVAKARDK